MRTGRQPYRPRFLTSGGREGTEFCEYHLCLLLHVFDHRHSECTWISGLPSLMWWSPTAQIHKSFNFMAPDPTFLANVSRADQVHSGFAIEHKKTASQILAEVKRLMTKRFSTQVIRLVLTLESLDHYQEIIQGIIQCKHCVNCTW